MVLHLDGCWGPQGLFTSNYITKPNKQSLYFILLHNNTSMSLKVVLSLIKPSLSLTHTHNESRFCILKFFILWWKCKCQLILFAITKKILSPSNDTMYYTHITWSSLWPMWGEVRWGWMKIIPNYVTIKLHIVLATSHMVSQKIHHVQLEHHTWFFMGVEVLATTEYC